MKTLSNLVNLSNIEDAQGTETIETLSTKDIAIIGISARLPMADSPQQFWENTKRKVNLVRPLPPTRKNDADHYLQYTGLRRKTTGYAQLCYLDEIDKFDYRFFNLSPRESSLMDPHQRLFLETAWQAIEDAGYGGGRLAGSQTGVYLGVRADDFYDYRNCILGVEPDAATSAFTGNMTSIIASRISYLLDLRGPSITIDTACSASLVAVHLACQSIRNRESEMAIAGGVRLNILPLAIQDRLGIESNSGTVKAFSNDADGTVIGEGVVAILLKPLAQALRDQDHIYAVIKGSSMNQDGSSTSLTAPNVIAQEELIVKAWTDAGIDPETITYIEAHGTGTRLGDPIEVEGIQRAFRRYTAKKQFCAIASVKTNIGHLDTTAGIAGLVQAVLALHHRTLPPSFHFQQPNQNINFTESPVYLNDQFRDWETGDFPRRCGVSSFGFSGTNCHIVLEEAPAIPEEAAQLPERIHVLALSAKSKGALQRLVEAYHRYLQTEIKLNLGALCSTANTGREHFGYRLALVCQDSRELRDLIQRACDSADYETINEAGIYYGANQAMTGRKGENGNEFQTGNFEQLEQKAGDMMVKFGSSGNQSRETIAALCELYVTGVRIDWRKLYKDGAFPKISLPVYPFERDRCWLDIPETGVNPPEENAGCYYTMVWEPAALRSEFAPDRNYETVLIFHDARNLGRQLAQDLSFQSKQVIEVSKGDSYRKIREGQYQVGNNDLDYDLLFAALPKTGGLRILHLMSVTGPKTSGALEELAAKQENGIYSLLYLVKALQNSGINEKIELILITEYASEVEKDQDRIQPENAMLCGLGKTIGWENPNIQCRYLDIDDYTDAATIGAEIKHPEGPLKIAYRKGQRYIETMVRADASPLAPEEEMALHEEGAYIITGGASGVGLEVGKYLAATKKINLVLIHRTRLPEPGEWDGVIKTGTDAKLVSRLKGIRELEASGATVSYYNADVANIDQMRSVIDDVKKKYGRICGVIHAAGIALGDITKQESYESFRRVLLPKVEGAWILDQLTQDEPLDFFVMFSSVITLIGRIGGGSYTAANTYLDAFTEYRNRLGRRTMTINWPSWENTGMLEGVTINEERELFKMLSVSQGIQIFGKLWPLNYQRVIVGELNYQGSIFELGDYLPVHLADGLKALITSRRAENPDSKSQGKQPAPEVVLKGKEDGNYTPVEKIIAQIWRERLGFTEINLHDNFFEIGGDSIMITKVHSLLEESFPGKVSVADLFLYPTIAELAEYIQSQEESPAGAAAVSDAQAENDLDAEISKIFDRVEKGQLSVDEANEIVTKWSGKE